MFVCETRHQFEEDSLSEMTDMDVDTVLQEDPRDSDNPAFLTPMQVFSSLHRPKCVSSFLHSISNDGKCYQLLKPADDHTSLLLVHETLEALARVSDPISVVTGVGTQRLGKSTLLNLFHSRVTAGFGLGHSLDAQVQALFRNRFFLLETYLHFAKRIR